MTLGLTSPTEEISAAGLLRDLGLRPVISCSGTASQLGGATLDAEVRAAMDAASQCFIPVAELQEQASRTIAEATGAEAGCIASGCDACLFIGVAACITRDDVAAMDQLPDTAELPNEVVVHRAHRNPFDHVLRGTGARFVEFGYVGPGAGVGAYRWQLEAAISERTAAVLYVKSEEPHVLAFADVVAIAHARGIPVIVDAAGGPIEPVREFIECGADLVACSGGKAIGGPGGTGLLAGRRDLIRAATVQQQDMFVYPGIWTAPFGAGGGSALDVEPPHQGLARAMKVGREEIVGLIVAIKRHVRNDHDARQRHVLAMAQSIFAGLESCKDVSVQLAAPPRSDGVLIQLRDSDAALRAAIALRNGEPRVIVGPFGIPDGQLSVLTSAVRHDEVEPLITRLREVLGR